MTIETKYNIGDEVFWVGYDETWHSGRILGIFITDNKIRYVLPELKTKERTYAIYVDETDLFPTEEELLKSL
jgi:hypothetical protein